MTDNDLPEGWEQAAPAGWNENPAGRAAGPTDAVFIPEPDDTDEETDRSMQQGRGPQNNDLRDPWFFTEDGQRWLAEQGEAAGDPGIAGF